MNRNRVVPTFATRSQLLLTQAQHPTSPVLRQPRVACTCVLAQHLKASPHANVSCEVHPRFDDTNAGAQKRRWGPAV